MSRSLTIISNGTIAESDESAQGRITSKLLRDKSAGKILSYGRNSSSATTTSTTTITPATNATANTTTLVVEVVVVVVS